MSRIFKVWSACLATAVYLAAVPTLTLEARAAAQAITPAVHTVPASGVTTPAATAMGGGAASGHAAASLASPLRTPSPEPGVIPQATTSGDLFPIGMILLVGMTVLAAAALATGGSVIVARGPDATRRVHQQQFGAGKADQSRSVGGSVGQAA
jgi:hypothetical protein